MQASLSAYTNLESLLLFQCLHAYGVDTSVWARISDLLTQAPDVTQQKHFQPSRLSPDALRAFYLERLRKELGHEQASSGDSPNGDAAPSTKRKRQTPPLPTVAESLQHQHLIPQLITKLYASYRNELVDQIRADEARYDTLQRDIENIQRESQPLSHPSQPLPGPSQSLSQPAAPHGASKNTPTPDSQLPSLAHDTLNGHPSPSAHRTEPAPDQRPASTTPRLPNIAPSPHPDTVQGPPPGPTGSQQSLQSSSYYSQPYSPAQQLRTPHMQPNPSPHQPISHATASPGTPFQPPFPPQLGVNGASQYGSPSGLPSQPGYPPPYRQQQPHGPHSPGTQTAHQPQRTQYPRPSQSPSASHHPQIGLPPPQAGFMLPPFQVSPQDPSRVHQPPHAQQPPPPVSTPISHRQQPPSSKSQVQTPGPAMQTGPPVHSLVTQAKQSFPTPTSASSTQSASGTPLSAKSFWKRQSSNNTPGTPASPRPEMEPLDDVPPLVQSAQSSPKCKSPRKSQARGKDKDKELEDDAEGASTPHVPSKREMKQRHNHVGDSLLDPGPRTGTSTSRRKGHNKWTRPGSLASSRAGGSVRGRSRSRSILSHTETVAGDNESQSGHQIKSERGTSVEPTEEEATETPSYTSRRRRRAVAPTVPALTRRKRNAREASLEEPEEQLSIPGLPKTILAQRHFSRMCAPIMNDINSHKYASTFTTAVRAKDAEGYYDIIKRPTDLKSIQKAIATGAKQVAAAAAAIDTPAGSPGGAGSGVVELANTSDHRPPKSIVNAAQLEKELMRMFVNAVMFNPGEDGVVEDAREMFKTVEQSVVNWRNVERNSGRTEIEDTPQAEDDESGQPNKRRKV